MSQPKVVAEDVVRHFGEVKALDGVSLTVAAGTSNSTARLRSRC